MLMINSKPSIVSEVCWAISNVAAGKYLNKKPGSMMQRQMLVDENILPLVIDYLSNSSYDIRKVKPLSKLGMLLGYI